MQTPSTSHPSAMPRTSTSNDGKADLSETNSVSKPSNGSDMLMDKFVYILLAVTVSVAVVVVLVMLTLTIICLKHQSPGAASPREEKPLMRTSVSSDDSQEGTTGNRSG